MSEYRSTIEKRLKAMGVIVVVITLILAFRMFDLQIIKHGHYLALAQGQQRFEKVEMAQRGKIYVHDSFSDPNSYYPLAFDVKKYAVWLVPHQINKKEEVAGLLEGPLNTPEKDIFEKINNDKLYIPPVKRGLSQDEAQKVKDLKITGVFVMPEYSRYYPEGQLASQLLGFVNSEGKGQYGFEGHYNSELTGTAGNVTGEKDTLGRVINLLDQQDPKDGTSYVLTIDRSVQYYVEKKLAQAIQDYQADSGTVVIMDIKTGGIVAMASTPTYDPNTFQDVAKSNSGLFINPAIAHLYEPGSIFKPIIMSAALDQGAVTPDTQNTFDWHTFVQGFEIKTAERKAFGLENMTQVLQNSDNVGMVWVSQQLGKENMYKYINNFNFFNKTGIDLDSEVSGYAPALKNWREINQATIAFGQGISVTPMEIVSAYASIANKGRYIYPHIVDKMVFADGTEKKVEKQEGEQVLKTDTARQLATMLSEVVKNGGSYANLRRGAPGFDVAAKTGTAQIPNPDGGGYLSSDNNLGVFVHSTAGFAPASDPKYAMLVKLDKPKTALYAESTAERLFADISNYLLNYYYRATPTLPLPQ